MFKLLESEPWCLQILACSMLVTFSLASPYATAQDEAKIVSAMRKIEQRWVAAIDEQTPMVSHCADQTWGIVRFSRGGSVTIDVRRTDSLISPFRGIVRIRGELETNNYSPKANGFVPKYTQPVRTVCFTTLADAQNATGQSDWRPYNNQPRVFDFLINYDIQQGSIRYSGGNEVFLNAVGGKITLSENAKGWAHLLVQLIE